MNTKGFLNAKQVDLSPLPPEAACISCVLRCDVTPYNMHVIAAKSLSSYQTVRLLQRMLTNEDAICLN